MTVMSDIPENIRGQAVRILVEHGLAPGRHFPELAGQTPAPRAANFSLDRLYLDGRSQKERSQWGQFHTPPWVVQALLNWREWSHPDRLIDPACGTGAFLVPAARRLADAGLGQGCSPRNVLDRVEQNISGYDPDPLAIFICRVNLTCALADVLRQIPDITPRWALHCEDFLQAQCRAESHDHLIGNPPWGVRLRGGAGIGYAQPAESAFVFLEAGLRMLPPGGRCTMVLPDTLLLKNYPAIRRLVLRRTRLLRIALLGRVFPQAQVEAVALDLVLAPAQPEGQEVEIWRSWGQALYQLPSVEQQVFSAAPHFRFNLLMSPPGLDLTRRMWRGKEPLGCSYRVSEGIHSGNIRRKLFVPVHPGKQGRCLLLKGKEVTPFRHHWQGNYVNYDGQLVNRSVGEYASLGRAPELAGPKVLVRRTGEKLVAAWDEQGFFISNNFFYCLPRSVASIHPKLLVCLLNSQLLQNFYHLQNPVMGRMFAELKIMHLNALPLPPATCPRLQAVQAELVRLHDELAYAEFPPERLVRLNALVNYIYAGDGFLAQDLEAHLLDFRARPQRIASTE